MSFERRPFFSPTADSPCIEAFCFNGGTCVEVGSNYTCKCADGFEGINCEVESQETDDGGSGGLGETDKTTVCIYYFIFEDISPPRNDSLNMFVFQKPSGLL